MKKNNKNPLISIIMPVYNAGDFLVEAIESIINQTYKNWELIAVDDASSDNSWQILKKFSKEDKRIKVYRLKKNYGLGYTANFAIKKAKGKFLARIDADDIIPKNRLALQINYLIKNPDILTVGGQCTLIDKNGKKIGKKIFPLKDNEIKKTAFYSMSLQAGTMMINRSLLPKDFDFYSASHYFYEDHELLFKLMKYGKLANLPQTLLYYRQHKNNSTKKVNYKKIFFAILWLRIKAFFSGIYPDLKGIILNIIQIFAVLFLPNYLINKIYFLWRIKNVKSNIIKKWNKKILFYKYRLSPGF